MLDNVEPLLTSSILLCLGTAKPQYHHGTWQFSTPWARRFRHTLAEGKPSYGSNHKFHLLVLTLSFVSKCCQPWEILFCLQTACLSRCMFSALSKCDLNVESYWRGLLKPSGQVHWNVRFMEAKEENNISVSSPSPSQSVPPTPKWKLSPWSLSLLLLTLNQFFCLFESFLQDTNDNF